MADIRATQSGNFSATSTWVGGVVPGSGDVAYTNGFTVTISDTRTVQAISNGSGTNITAGGTFSLLNGCNLTCTNAIGVVLGSANTLSCVTTASLGLGSSSVLAANVTLPEGGRGLPVILHSSLGTLNIVGNLSGATANSGGSPALRVNGSGVVNHTGNVTGSTNQATSPGMDITGNATVNTVGNVLGGGQSVGVSISASSANVTFTGAVTGAANAGITSTGSSVLTVNGICQSGITAPAIGAGSVTQITRLSGPFLLGTSGNINPVQAQSWRWAPTLVPTYMQVTQSDGSALRLFYSADNMPEAGYPAVSNVRHSVVYGPTQELVGTLAVPSPSSVAVGVSTDNTVGTAVLTGAAAAAAVWSATTRTLTSSSSSAPTAAEVAVAVRSELTTELGRVDAPISTRLASASYSAAPTTAAIRTELSVELARLDAAVSSRLAPAGTLATVTTLTNTPSVPSAATIASQVRTELTTELARVDAAVSTRLAASSYTAPTTPPTAAAIRTEMDTNSTKLTSLADQMSNKASVDQVAAIVQAATSA